MTSFYQANALARLYSGKAWWKAVYQQVFPYFKKAKRLPGTHQLQNLGVDKILRTEAGKDIFLEEKFDRTTYDNFFLEYISNLEKETPGWLVKPVLTDYLAYVRLGMGKCYFIPFPPLQMAWLEHGDRWLAEYGPKTAGTYRNGGFLYDTVGCCVPMTEVLSKVHATIIDISEYLPEVI